MFISLFGAIKRNLKCWGKCVSVQEGSHIQTTLPSNVIMTVPIKAPEQRAVTSVASHWLTSAVNINQTNSVLNFICPC